ncbi:hypothetical protein PIB30_026159 [Stylosanthes scabra]|uniref:Uncharacterized protein n=1 Tax=Stylosanthes scabra TaxID=79078 RepID=A0ABU6VBS7_9FABA|nr:hypothetical protein [Stylosanthes scabra]
MAGESSSRRDTRTPCRRSRRQAALYSVTKPVSEAKVVIEISDDSVQKEDTNLEQTEVEPVAEVGGRVDLPKNDVYDSRIVPVTMLSARDKGLSELQRTKVPAPSGRITQPQDQQQEFLSNFYTHFDNSMSMIYRRFDSQQEESRKSFEALNTRMNRFHDQLSYLCYSTQMTNEQMLSPYQVTTRLMREMEMQEIPVTMANLAIHRQKEEEMRQERMRYDQVLQEAAAKKSRKANKGKAREVVEDSDEDTDELTSSASEEW